MLKIIHYFILIKILKFGYFVLLINNNLSDPIFGFKAVKMPRRSNANNAIDIKLYITLLLITMIN